MDSIKRVDSSSFLSSMISDLSQKNDDFEITTKTNSMLKLLLEAASDTNAENSVLGNEIIELLTDLNVDVKSLPNDIKEGMQVATAILKSEGLSSLDGTALKLSLEKRNLQNKMKEREERQFKAKYNAAFAKYNILQEKLNRIRTEIEEIEHNLKLKMSSDENSESNRILCLTRLHDYKEAIQKLEQELDTLHTQEFELDRTLQKSSLLMDRLRDLNEINKNLAQYEDLPPNLLQARIALECKQRELKDIENLINDKINS